jgi:hypothetical protein
MEAPGSSPLRAETSARMPSTTKDLMRSWQERAAKGFQAMLLELLVRPAGALVAHRRKLAAVVSSAIGVALSCSPDDALVGWEYPGGESGYDEVGSRGGGPAGSGSAGGVSTGAMAGMPAMNGGAPTIEGGTAADSGATTNGGMTMDGGGTTDGGAMTDGGATTGGGGTTGGSGGTTHGGAIGELVGTLDGRLIQFPCATSAVTDDCQGLGYVVDGVITACEQGRSEMVLDHPIAGTPGARYQATMHFYGIMEPKNLGNGVTREAGALATNRNGGAPLPWATAPAGTNIPQSNYSAYELRVHDEAGQEVARYFLNSDINEGHWSFIIDYEKNIEIIGGGFVRLRHLDPNCRVMKNCGDSSGVSCEGRARTIDLSAAEPPPPSGPFPVGFNQPGLNQSPGNSGQWWMIDVTAAWAL